MTTQIDWVGGDDSPLSPEDVGVHPQWHEANEMVAGADWEPGEPLYGTCTGGFSRQLFQIIPDPIACWWGMYWCHDCDVIWSEYEWDGDRVAEKVSPNCWMCGAVARHPDDAKEQEFRSRQAAAVAADDIGGYF